MPVSAAAVSPWHRLRSKRPQSRSAGVVEVVEVAGGALVPWLPAIDPAKKREPQSCL